MQMGELSPKQQRAAVSAECGFQGHVAFKATRPSRPRGLQGHAAAQSSKGAQGHVAFKATWSSRPRGLQGHVTFKVTCPSRPRGLQGHVAAQSSKGSSRPRGLQGHVALKATWQPKSSSLRSQGRGGSPDRGLRLHAQAHNPDSSVLRLECCGLLCSCVLALDGGVPETPASSFLVDCIGRLPSDQQWFTLLPALGEGGFEARPQMRFDVLHRHLPMEPAEVRLLRASARVCARGRARSGLAASERGPRQGEPDLRLPLRPGAQGGGECGACGACD